MRDSVTWASEGKFFKPTAQAFKMHQNESPKSELQYGQVQPY